MKAKDRQMWVFKDELIAVYQNAPYQSTIHRIERYAFQVYDPLAELIAFRVLHTPNTL